MYCRIFSLQCIYTIHTSVRWGKWVVDHIQSNLCTPFRYDLQINWFFSDLLHQMHWFYKFLSSFPTRHNFWGNSIGCIWQLPNEVICTWFCTLAYQGSVVRVQSRRLACSNSVLQFNQYIVRKAPWPWWYKRSLNIEVAVEKPQTIFLVEFSKDLKEW